MDVIEIQYKRGTVVRDIENNKILEVNSFDGNFVHFAGIKDGTVQYDYKWQLGKRYTKDKTYKVLYGRK